MREIIKIRGKPVIEIYESFEGSYWFITEKCHKQDSVIHGKVYKDDQILYGYVRLAVCPECAEWGYISETELNLLGSRVWKVPRKNWDVCPEVEVIRIPSGRNETSNKDRDIIVSRPGCSRLVELEINALMEEENMNAERWFEQLEMIESVKRQIRAAELQEAAEEERVIRQAAEKRAWIFELVYQISPNTNSMKGGSNEYGI